MSGATCAVDLRDGAEARRRWGEEIRRVFGAVELAEPGGAGFTGRLSIAELGAIAFTDVVSSQEDARRTPRLIAGDAHRAYVLSFVRAGMLEVEQHARRACVTAGGFVLFDLGAPYRYSHAETADVLSVVVPRALMEGRVRNPARHVCQAGAATRGVGAAMRRAVEALAAEADGIPPLAGAALATRTVDLVAILLEAAHEAPAAAPSSGDVLFRRIVAHIDSNLTDARLDPARIAAAFGISVRTLHKLFHDRDQSVGQRLLKERLKRCHDDLTRPDLERTPIKEIALRAGFRSQAHFASAFRRAYRTTPTALRNAARRGA